MLLHDCSSLHRCGLAVVIFHHNIISAIFLSDHFFVREGVSVVMLIVAARVRPGRLRLVYGSGRHVGVVESRLMLMFRGSGPQRRRLHASPSHFPYLKPQRLY